MKFVSFVLLIATAFYGWQFFHRPIEYPPGVLISSEPEQTETTDVPIERGEYQLRPLAHFALYARVLHSKIYHWDRQSKLVPVDLALGWGAMSDQRVLDQVRVSQ